MDELKIPKTKEVTPVKAQDSESNEIEVKLIVDSRGQKYVKLPHGQIVKADHKFKT